MSDEEAEMFIGIGLLTAAGGIELSGALLLLLLEEAVANAGSSSSSELDDESELDELSSSSSSSELLELLDESTPMLKSLLNAVLAVRPLALGRVEVELLEDAVELKIGIEFSSWPSFDVALELLPVSLSIGLLYDEPFAVLPFRLFELIGGDLVAEPFDWLGSFGDTDFAC